MIVGLSDSFQRSSFSLAHDTLALGFHPITEAHIIRVGADGGTIEDVNVLDAAVRRLVFRFGNNLSAKLVSVIHPAIFGYKSRTDSTGTYCTKAYCLMGASTDILHETASNQPLLFIYNGVKYLVLASASGNNIQTPNSASNAITGDVDISFYVDKNAGPTSSAFGKESNLAATGAFVFWSQAVPANQLGFQYSNGAAFITRVSTANHTENYVRAKRTASTGDITFYESADGLIWTQLGAVVASPAGNMNAGALPLSFNIGNAITPTTRWRTTGGQLWSGDRDAGGVLVSELNMSDYDVSISQNTVSSSTTGEAWTINRGTATTGYKTQAIYMTTMQGNAISNNLKSGAITQAQPFTVYAAFDQMTWTVSKRIVDLNTSTNSYIAQSGVSPNIVAGFGSNLSYTGDVLNRLKIYSVLVNGAASATGVNDVYSAPGNPGAGGIDRIGFPAPDAPNIIANSLIITKEADSVTTRTYLYEALHDWNGNPI